MNQSELNKTNNYPRILVGTSDFKKLRSGSDIIVDKSLFIKTVLEDEDEVLLITRPRRWGKSLNLSMLKYFFELEVDSEGKELSPKEKANPKLFLGGKVKSGAKERYLPPLEISKDQDSLEEQGQYPVILFSLKNTRGGNYKEVKSKVKIQVFEAFVKHRYLRKYLTLDNDFLEVSEKKRLNRYLSGDIDETDLKYGLRFLSELLYKHFKKEIFILVDEYDETINDAYVKFGYESEEFKKVLELIREILSAALKDVTYLKKAVLTGIYRVAKTNIFSGLNNVGEYTLLEPEFGEYYGFTQEEVDFLLNQKLPGATPEKIQEIKDWYDGYNFGEQNVYNPLSIVRCLTRRGRIDTYWMNTGSTDLIDQALLSDDIQEDLQTLLAGQNVTKRLYREIAFEQIKEERKEERKRVFCSLLVFAGYLSPNPTDKRDIYKLSIPNREVRQIYEERVIQWVTQKLNIDAVEFDILLRPLLKRELKEIKEFEKTLREFLLRSGSYHDSSEEKDYHNLMNGLLSYLGLEFLVISNCESGDGRYDHALIPRVEKPRDIAFLFEYKKAVSQEDKELDLAAAKGLDQIDQHQYDTRVKEHSQVQRIIKIGLAFRGKKLKAKYKMEERISGDGWRVIKEN